MSYPILFSRLEQQLLTELSTSTPDLYNAVQTIFSNYKQTEMSTDCMVAEFYAVLNGAFATLLEAIRDMGYNLEGIQESGNRVRSFQFLNQIVERFPRMSRYDLGAFFGAVLPTVVDLSVGCDPTFHEAVFEDVKGLQVLKLPVSFGRVPSRFLAGSSIVDFEAPSVSMIGANAFYNCKTLVTLRTAEINGVDDYGFFNCSQLQVLPGFFDEMVYVGTKAFAQSGICTVRLSSPNFIGDYAFSGMCNLVAISANVSTIPYNFASNCRNLVNVNIPSAKAIRAMAFARCSKLVYLQMPSDVTIFSRAFYSTGLTSVDLSNAKFEGTSQFELCLNLESLWFSTLPVLVPNRFCCGCLNLKQLSTKIPATPNSRIIMSDGKIGSAVFKAENDPIVYGVADDENLFRPICLQNHLTAPHFLTVGQDAFSWCSKLKHVNLWRTHRIGMRAFKSSGIVHLVTQAQIESEAFAACARLHAILMPCQKCIPAHAFENCKSLVSLSTHATSIGSCAFAGCTNLRVNFVSTSSCHIGMNAFSNTIVDKVSVGDESKIAAFAFFNTGTTKNGAHVCTGNKSRISKRAFMNSSVASLTIGKDAVVGAYAFRNSSLLKYVVSDSNLLCQGAFSACERLKHFLVKRPFHLSTRRHYDWKRSVTGVALSEIFPNTFPDIQILSAGTFPLCCYASMEQHDRRSLLTFFYGCQKAKCKLPQELNLEIAFAFFLTTQSN